MFFILLLVISGRCRVVYAYSMVTGTGTKQNYMLVFLLFWFLLLLKYSWFTMLLIFAIQQSDSVIHIYTFFKIFFSIMVYLRMLNIVPCAQGLFNIPKSVSVIHHINKRKDQNHMIISIDAEKTFDRIQHSFMIKRKPLT